MEKIGKIKQAADCVSLNETTRTSFEVSARNVFKKYKALYPAEEVRPYVKEFNAIDAIYSQLNQKVKSADVTELMMRLQRVVDENILIRDRAEDEEEVYVDLSHLDFDKLKAAFANSKRKNTIVYDLQQAVEKQLQRMLKENPLRLEFYDRYKEIIDEYNKGKSLENTMKAFEDLEEFIKDLDVEEKRAVRNNLSKEDLAIFDLLKAGKDLSSEELKDVKKVAAETLKSLKQTRLNIERWRESRQIRAQVRQIISDHLLYLPEEHYDDEELALRTTNVYQHIFSSYPGGGQSVYTS